ncbi:Alpha-1A adrenergic receptor [Holothuria leucospilota]|uniref:Alpha-1A adrenergic receptor n=1 Tax=Holothuria leucospilota TaxID=206669 RepID=A0A9Q0YS81_HOLLE|nr:Alpha-1A adrenergic receptor [Holothuria leucospilota]
MKGIVFVVVILTLNVGISIIGVLGNGMVIVAFSMKARLRTRSNCFIISLLIMSFIHCAIFFPLQALADVGIISGRAACFSLGCLGLTESVAITLCLLATSMERFIAICWPLKADSILTTNRTIATFVVIAVYSFTSGIIFPSLTWIGYDGPPLDHQCTLLSLSPVVGYTIWLSINWLAPIPVMLVIYCKILLIVRRHAREISAHVPRINPDISPNRGNNEVRPGLHDRPAEELGGQQNDSFSFHPDDVDTPSTGVHTITNTTPQSVEGNGAMNIQKKRQRRRMRSDVKSALVIFAIVMLYSLNFIPYVIYLFTKVIHKTPDIRQAAIVHAVLFANYALNPYIYGFGNRNIRKAITQIFCKRRSASRSAGLISISETMS